MFDDLDRETIFQTAVQAAGIIGKGIENGLTAIAAAYIWNHSTSGDAQKFADFLLKVKR